MSLDVDRLLDARPAWAERARRRWRTAIAADPVRRRRWLAVVVIAWQLGDAIAPRHQVAGVRRLLLVMIVLDSVATYVWVAGGIASEANPMVAAALDTYGIGPGLLLRTLWSVALVLALTWLAERRASVRPALVVPLVALGAVTLLHISVLAQVWWQLLGS
ncbi:MAG: DUF5658 family protein [Nitriliruptoraceae bacterium]